MLKIFEFILSVYPFILIVILFFRKQVLHFRLLKKLFPKKLIGVRNFQELSNPINFFRINSLWYPLPIFYIPYLYNKEIPDDEKTEETDFYHQKLIQNNKFALYSILFYLFLLLVWYNIT